MSTDQDLAWLPHTTGRNWWLVWDLRFGSSPQVGMQVVRSETAWRAGEGQGMTCWYPRLHSGPVERRWRPIKTISQMQWNKEEQHPDSDLCSIIHNIVLQLQFQIPPLCEVVFLIAASCYNYNTRGICVAGKILNPLASKYYEAQ